MMNIDAGNNYDGGGGGGGGHYNNSNDESRDNKATTTALIITFDRAVVEIIPECYSIFIIIVQSRTIARPR